MKTTIDDAHVTQVVQYELDGELVFFGVLEYVRDGWCGIRQPHDGGRLDEAPAHLCRVDPT